MAKAVKAYMIHDPKADKWFHIGALGMYGWDVQPKGEIWTVKKSAEDVLARMLSSRAKQAVIKTFLLVPAISKD